MRQKKSKNSFIPEAGILGQEFKKGEKVITDKGREVIVVSQRPLRNFTTVYDGNTTFTIATSRLTKTQQ
jgi:DNA integrity scanning protein DisA with diadenylate cyclase activity